MDRRTLLQSALGFAVMPAQPNARLPIATAVEFDMLPPNLPIAERFRMAKDAGFERIECPTTPDEGIAKQMKQAADDTGLPIHSVMNMDHWKYPLSAKDPAVVARSLEGARTSIRNAALWGATTVLIVPAVVNETVSYSEAYQRSQESIMKLLPLAGEMKVTIAVEEVWNKFLLSPVEFAQYVDSFKTPWVRAYFDVGNVVLYGYPQDWIRTLGNRIVKLHIKDFSFRRDPQSRKTTAEWVNLGEGDINWPEIYSALRDVGFKGTATTELAEGDAPYLKDVCHRLESVLSGQMQKAALSKTTALVRYRS